MSSDTSFPLFGFPCLSLRRHALAPRALQAAERLPIEASQMLIAGAVNFVVFIQRRNNYQTGGRLQRMVTSVREVNGVDGRVLSSEVFAEAPDGRIVPHAPIACLEDLIAQGYRPTGTWG